MSEKVEENQEDIIDYTKHYKKYYENLAGERLKEVAKLAKQNVFEIDMYDDETGDYKVETFKYKEIPTKRWMELEKLRSKYGDVEKLNGQRVNIIVGDKEAAIYNYGQQMGDLLTELYEKSAEYFLGISKERFGDAKWTQIKTIIDACNHRTIFSLPNSVSK